MTTVDEAYSRRAAEYADLFGSMRAVHPSDRQLVESWADTVDGRILDAGCGPGHWTNHLARRGKAVRGIDLVPAFIERARSSYPDVPFAVASIDRIDEPTASLGGILSWYSTIHHTPGRIAVPLAEFARTIRPGGALLVGYFDGGASIEEFDHAVAPAYRWPMRTLHEVLRRHGFDVVESHRRTGCDSRPHGAVICRRGDA
ncbi:class I SAM-dependent methyltransferase [Cellulomonas endometrii]|uniref:class I SAM-dependent methyltransferase n=1 Tax=Cellulomonas endometrii TaxID=3036301 RepID=UPI0024AD7124|nr:class I SAM-dependent methyltransferase [Cellulomonas endometrii]